MLSRSVVSDSVTPWTVACKTSLSMGILQARIQEWVAMHSSRGSSQPRDRIQVSHIAGILYRLSYQRHVHTRTHAHTQSRSGGSDGKESACNTRYPDLIPGSGRSPGGGNGDPLQDSCLENPMDGGAWRAPVHGVAKSWTPLRVSTNTYKIKSYL